MRTNGCCRTVDREISRFPCKERLHMPGSLTTPGRVLALAMTRQNVLPSAICTASAPRIGIFRGSMVGLCAPLSTLRRNPRGQLRMTRGRCGSLLLHRKRLALSTPCRSPGASQMFSALPQNRTSLNAVGMSVSCHFRTHRYGKGGVDQYQPIEKRRLLHERLIRTIWSNARLFRGEVQRKSSWQFGD